MHHEMYCIWLVAYDAPRNLVYACVHLLEAGHTHIQILLVGRLSSYFLQFWQMFNHPSV